MTYSKILLSFAIIAIAHMANAVVLESWEVSDGIVANAWASSANDVNLDPAPWTPGAGTAPDWSSSASNIRFRFFSADSPAGAINAEDYFEFTITPKAKVQYSVDSLNLYGGISNGTVALELRSSLDGYASALDSLQVDDNDADQVHTWTITGSLHDDLTTPVSFRLYGYSVAPTGHTFNIAINAGNDAWVEGTSSLIPEPGQTALAIGSVLLIMVVWHRRK